MKTCTAAALEYVAKTTPPFDPALKSSTDTHPPQGTRPADTPGAPAVRGPETQNPFQTPSGSPWPPEGERAAQDLTRREQFLAVQLKAHRLCVAQLADERARFESEREALIARAVETTAARVREELATERTALEQRLASESAELERLKQALARRESELEQARHEAGHSSSGHPAANGSRSPMAGPETNHLLGDLARKAAEFSGIVEGVMLMQRQLAEARTTHEAMNQRHMEELQEREQALEQREAAATEQLRAAEESLEAERQRVVLAQQETARLEQDVKERRSELVRRQAEITTAEQEIVAARQEAMGMLQAAARAREELDVASANLKLEAEAVERSKQEQAEAQAELNRRGEELAEQLAAAAETERRLAGEAEALREQAAAVEAERVALTTQRDALAAEETALSQKILAFDERQKKFQAGLSSLMSI